MDETSRKGYTTIIMGDFNGVQNLKLDRINSVLRGTETNLIKTIIDRGYKDYYRLVNGNTKEYTFYKNINQIRKPSSRIDQIWVALGKADVLIQAKIINTEFSAHSDHDAMMISINNRKFVKNAQYNKN